MDFSSPAIGSGYQRSIYDNRRSSTISEQSSSSYGPGFGSARSGGSSSFCSPLQPQTPTQPRNMLQESAIIDTPHHGNDKAYGGQCSAHIPTMQLSLPDREWVASEAQSIRFTSSSHDDMPFSTINYDSKPYVGSIVPVTEMYSPEALTPPSSTHGMTPNIQYSPPSYSLHGSRSNTPSAWQPPQMTSFDNGGYDDRFSFSSNESSMVRGHSVGLEMGHEVHHYHPTYPASPPGQRPVNDYDCFRGYHTQRIGRVPTGGKHVPRDRTGAGISKKKLKSHKTDVGYLNIPHGSHIPVKIQGDLKKDLNGRWTTAGAEPEKHRCEMMRGEEKCSRTFKRIEHLRRHMRTHTQEQPFACDFPTEKVEDGLAVFEHCGKLFQRNDNCVAHFKTHVSQDKHGLYFPMFEMSKESIEGASNDYLVKLAGDLQSRIPSDDRKKGSRNPRVTWEDFLLRIRQIKTPEESQKIVASVFKSCLKDDEKTRSGSR